MRELWLFLPILRRRHWSTIWREASGAQVGPEVHWLSAVARPVEAAGPLHTAQNAMRGKVFGRRGYCLVFKEDHCGCWWMINCRGVGASTRTRDCCNGLNERWWCFELRRWQQKWKRIHFGGGSAEFANRLDVGSEEIKIESQLPKLTVLSMWFFSKHFSWCIYSPIFTLLTL